jgi:hypothetical protein
LLSHLGDGSLRADDVAARRSRFPRCLFQEAILKSLIHVALLSLMSVTPAPAEKLVDPTSVAPEYREAAEKRRIEQIKQRECAHKADVGKILPRERTAFLLQCLETESGAK